MHRFQCVAAYRAETYHRQVVCEVDVPGVQLDAAHSKLRPRQVAWIHTALAMGSWFLLWVDVGPRTQEHAAAKEHLARHNRAAAVAFLLWNKACVHGVLQEVKGLTNRRTAGRALYLKA